MFFDCIFSTHYVQNHLEIYKKIKERFPIIHYCYRKERKRQYKVIKKQQQTSKTEIIANHLENFGLKLRIDLSEFIN